MPETKAASAENNDITVSTLPGQIVFEDASPVTQIGGCVQDGSNRAKCPLVLGDYVYVFVGDGTNKVYSSTGFPSYVEGTQAAKNTFRVERGGVSTLFGGSGPDSLTGGSGAETIHGLGGDDELAGKGGKDGLVGGAGNDLLVPGHGPDVVSGEGDVDTVTYLDHNNAVSVTLFDNLPNDGNPAEGDTVKTDVENVEGTIRNDKITGSFVANDLFGGIGDDTIYGGGGPDRLFGEVGEDDLHGQAGADTEYGGNDDDYVDGGSDGDLLYGILGDDKVSGGSGDDTLNGGPGTDELRGGSEDDALAGKSEDDTLFGDAGADKIAGGTGEDTVSYAALTLPVTVDLDGVNYDDGPEGEGGSVATDIERIIGGTAADVLTGNAKVNVLRGGAGGDTLNGGEGADQLFGEAGTDTLQSKDASADTDNCGAGTDEVSADPVDKLLDCEQPAGNAGNGGNGGSNASPGPSLRIGPGKLRLSRGGYARLRVRCSVQAQTRCVGSLRLRHRLGGKARTIGSRRFSIATGRTATVKVKVFRRARRAIARRSRKVTAEGIARDAVSASRTTTRRITIKRAVSR